MINYLKDCQKTTLIGQLPDIINSNNESIRNEFNWIYDSSLNRLTKSVYAPTGSVKSHFGEFVNLACEYITIKNVDSLKNSIQDCVNSIMEDMSHNNMKTRFISNEFTNTNFMHDADSIVYNKITDDNYISVKQQLDILSNKLNIIEEVIESVHDENISNLISVKMLINDLYKASNNTEILQIVRIAQNNKSKYITDDSYIDALLNETNDNEILEIVRLINNRTFIEKLYDIAQQKHTTPTTKTPTVDEQLLNIIRDAKSRKSNFNLNSDDAIKNAFNAINDNKRLYFAKIINNRTLKGKISNAIGDYEKISIIRNAQKTPQKFELSDSFILALLNAVTNKDILDIIKYGVIDNIHNSSIDSSNSSIYYN